MEVILKKYMIGLGAGYMGVFWGQDLWRN
jgi:hypothetical protein